MIVNTAQFLYLFSSEVTASPSASRPTQDNDYASLSPFGVAAAHDVTHDDVKCGDDVDDDPYMYINDVDLQTLTCTLVTDGGCTKRTETCDVIANELSSKDGGHVNSACDQQDESGKGSIYSNVADVALRLRHSDDDVTGLAQSRDDAADYTANDVDGHHVSIPNLIVHYENLNAQ